MREFLQKRQPQKCLVILEELKDATISGTVKEQLNLMEQHLKKYKSRDALVVLEEILKAS